jgi:hypothetical protein
MTQTQTDHIAVLCDTAERAYERARRLVFDRIPLGRPIDRDSLDPMQVRALDDLEAAEAARHARREHATGD